MPSSKLVLSENDIIELARNALRFVKCEWGKCPLTLNSWAALRKHLYRHCRRHGAKTDAGAYFCQIRNCMGNYHNSVDDIQYHVDMSHMSRFFIPCPARDCKEEFARQGALVDHFQTIHSVLIGQPSTSVAFKRMWFPSTPAHPDVLPALPAGDIPSHEAYPIPVQLPSQESVRTWSSRQQTARGRKWSRMDGPQEDDDDEAECAPFEDLPEFDARDTQHEVRDYVVRRKPPEESSSTLSRPQPVVDPDTHEDRPELRWKAPESVTYPMFKARYKELEDAGLVVGTGVWPEHSHEHSMKPS